MDSPRRWRENSPWKGATEVTSFLINDPDGRIRIVRSVKEPPTERERVAAARARVSADKLRGAETAQWIVDLAARDR